jgi:hypothetical protein
LCILLLLAPYFTPLPQKVATGLMVAVVLAVALVSDRHEQGGAGDD